MQRACLFAIAAVLCCTGTALATSYSNDFEGDTIGLLPLDPGWYVTPPWWGTRTITGTVEAGPTGGQVLEVHWQDTFDGVLENFSSGEVGYTMDLTGVQGGNMEMTAEYDFWVENTGIWQMFGDQASGALLGGALNDSNVERDWMYVGRDDGSGKPADILDIPDGAWIHYVGAYSQATGQMDSTVSFVGGSGGFTQQLVGRVDGIDGEYWWGGWAYDFQMLSGNEGTPREGTYDHALYIDNFSMSVVPEPGTISLIGAGLVALVALKRRKK